MFLILSWPVRTLSFSHDGEMLASGSEDLIIDIVCITYLVGNNLIVVIIYDLYRAYTGSSMRHYNDKKKQYIELL